LDLRRSALPPNCCALLVAYDPLVGQYSYPFEAGNIMYYPSSTPPLLVKLSYLFTPKYNFQVALHDPHFPSDSM